MRAWNALGWLAVAALLVWRVGLLMKAAGKGDAYPNKPIQVVTPYPAGGGSDTFVRRVIQRGLEESGAIDVPIVVINQAGGGGVIGSRFVKDARPDGYRILCHHNAMLSSQLSGAAPFGPDDFAKIAQTGALTMVIMVREDSPFKTLPDLLEAARASPNKITFGANVGSPAYFTTLQMEKAFPGAKFSVVSANGGADRYSRLIGGHLDAGIFSLSEYLDFRDSDDTPPDRNVRALAALSRSRHPALPDTATGVEQGVPVTMANANYWWAPKDTPQAVLDTLANILEQALATDAAREEMERLRIDPVFQKGAAVDRQIQATMDEFRSVAVAKETNVPNFVRPIAVIVAALFVAVLAANRGNRAGGKPDRTASDTAPPFVKRPGMAAACFAVLAAYTAMLGWAILPFAITTAAMVFTVGGLMARWERGQLAVIAQLALLTGLGSEFLFTSIFTVALP